jgi:hypothetical protein
MSDIESSALTLPDSIIPLTVSIATKLNQNNYLTSKCEILPIIHGYNLFPYLNPTSTPTPIIIATSATLFINPAYAT